MKRLWSIVLALTASFTLPLHAAPGDLFTDFMDATTVVGQANFTDQVTTSSQTTTPNAVACAVSVTGKLAIASQSRRVQLWNSIPTTNGAPADVVLGKPDFTSTTGGVTASLMSDCNGVCFSPDGSKLIASDSINNRVLIWNTIPTVNGTPADVVIGQSSFTTNAGGTSATAMWFPAGVFVTPGGKLLVAEFNNHRVLVFDSIPTVNGTAADLVIGQPNMTTNSAGNTANKMNRPWNCAVTADGRLLVAEESNHRVVVFNSFPTANGASADVVIGQTGFGVSGFGTSATQLYIPIGVAVSPSGQLAIGEFFNHRVVIYNSVPTVNGAAADVVLGQPDFTSRVAFNGGVSSRSMRNLYQPAFTADGRLIVTGRDMHRAMIFGAAGSTSPEIAVFNGGAVTDPELTNNTGTVAFGSLPAGAAGAARAFTVQNTGSGTLNLGTVASSSADFVVSTAGMAAALGAGESTRFYVTFSPAGAGPKSGVISIASDDADENPFEIAVTGTGLPPPVVTAVLPARGRTPGGSSVTITGANFTGATDVTFGGTSATDITVVDAGTITATTPAHAAGTVSVEVTTPNGANAANTLYTYILPDATVASTGQWLLGVDGVAGGGMIYRPLPGVINAAGSIAFKAGATVGTGGVNTGNDQMLLTDSSGSLAVVARKGGLVQVSPWQTLAGQFNNVLLLGNGGVVSTDLIKGAPAASDRAYLISPDGVSLDLLSREGDAAPDGGTFTTHTGKPAADDLNHVYFRGAVKGPAATKDTGVWYDDGSGIARLVHEGLDVSAVTGDPAWLGQFSSIIAAGGEGAAFVAALQNNPDDKTRKTLTALNQAVFSAKPGSLSLVARKGTDLVPRKGAAPIPAKITVFNGVARSSNEEHALLVTLAPGTTANNQALLMETDGTVELVARKGVTPLAGALTASRFGAFHITRDGDVIFLAWLNGATTATDGVLCRWRAHDGSIELLAREGAAAPGVGAGFNVLQILQVSPGGAVLLQGTLSNGRTALFKDVGAGLEKVVQTTESVDFNGAPRAILALATYNSSTGTGGGGGGMGSAINDAGEVFAVLSLGDGGHLARVFR